MLKHYFNLNWPVLPLLPGDIRPPFPWREFQEKPPGEREWTLWREIFPIPPHGIGLLTGCVSGIVVVDIDDPAVAERFQVEVPFSTPFVKTRRGFHYYFRADGDIPSTKVEIPGIGQVEIKADGSLVPLPPTRHRKDPNFRYEWIIPPWEAEIPPLPDFIFEAIERQARERELARAVGRVTFPKPSRELTPEILREILAQVGAEVVKEIFVGDREAWRLKVCPLCGKSEGSPWVWADTGRLLDFRVTCLASRNNGGLPLRAWLQELGREDLLGSLAVKEESEEAPPSQVPVASVKEARNLILQALRGGDDFIITVPPGVGKSRTTLEWFCQEGPRPVVYSVPTLSLAQELAEEARKLTADPVVLFEGRNSKTCLRWEEARIAHELGYDPGEVLCSTCQHNPKSAVFSKKCEFMRQFEGVNKQKGLFFCSHKLACHLIGDFLKNAKIWVLDEEPHDLIEVVSGPLDGLRTLRAVFPENSATMRLTESILKLGDELHRATNEKRRDFEGRIYARPVDFGPWASRKTLQEFLDLDFTALAPEIREEIEQVLKTHRKSKLFKQGVNFHALQWLQEIVGQGQAYLVARKDPKLPLELRRTVNPVPDKWRGRLIVLDATAYSPVVERVLKRPGMQVLDVRVPVEVRTAWLKRSVSKTGIIRARGRNVALKALKEALKVIKAEKILVFCHQAIKAQVEEAAVQDGGEVVVTHHFGSEGRGVNRFADFGAVVLLGLPVANPSAYYDVALSLGLSAKEWEEWINLLSKAESLQEAHRIRLILGSGKEVVVIAPRWPFREWLGSPHEVIEPEEVKGTMALCSRVLGAWIAVFHFVWKEIALLLGIGRAEEIPPADIRAQIWERVAQAYPEQVRTFLEQSENLYKTPETPFDLPDLSQKIPESKEGKGVSPVFNNIIKTPETPLVWEVEGTPRAFHLSLKEIRFKGRGWWRLVLYRLRKEHPDLPVFEVAIRTPGGLQRTRGLGDIEAAKAFCRAIGLKTNENAWEYINA